MNFTCSAIQFDTDEEVEIEYVDDDERAIVTNLDGEVLLYINVNKGVRIFFDDDKKRMGKGMTKFDVWNPDMKFQLKKADGRLLLNSMGMKFVDSDSFTGYWAGEDWTTPEKRGKTVQRDK